MQDSQNNIQLVSDSHLESNSDSVRVEHVVGSSSSSSELRDQAEEGQQQEAEEMIHSTSRYRGKRMSPLRKLSTMA